MTKVFNNTQRKGGRKEGGPRGGGERGEERERERLVGLGAISSDK